MDKELLTKKWLADQLSQEELEAFKQTGDYQKNLRVIRYANQFKAPEYSPSDHLETLLEAKPGKQAVTKKLWPSILRVAAAILLGFVVYYFYPTTGMVSIATAVSEKTTIELPDDSKVTINAGSAISYSKNTWKLWKQVDLQGEAYFDVVKDGKFKVITPEGTVAVLGTKFNVKQRDHYFEVICYEGIVKVTSDQYEQVLRAGEVLQDLDGQVQKSRSVNQEPQWTSNISTFRNAPIYLVIDELSRQYDIEITTHQIDSGKKFTGGFVHDDLENALIGITEPLNLSYSINHDRKVTIEAK